MIDAKIVQLSELEFHKLMRFTDAVTALEAQAELWLAQVRQRVDAARKVKEDFFRSLQESHPELDPSLTYTPVEATLTLNPIHDNK